MLNNSLIIFIVVFSGAVHAEQIYKCQANGGLTSFQQLTCDHGISETYEIQQPNVITNPSNEQNLVNADSNSDDSKYQQLIADRDQQICQVYKNSLVKVQATWDELSKTSYEPSQKELFEKLIQKGQSDVQNHCPQNQ